MACSDPDHQLELSLLKRVLGPDHWRLASARVDDMQGIERRYAAKVQKAVLDAAADSTPDNPLKGWERVLIALGDHAFETTYVSTKAAESEVDLIRSSHVKLSGPPNVKITGSSADVKKLWDMVRRGVPPSLMPKKQREMYNAIKKRVGDIEKSLKQEYLKRVTKAWKEWGKDWRSGKAEDKIRATDMVQREVKVPRAQAKMIVATETTYYDNRARREYYDASPDVEGYLYMAIRDHRTTIWCKSRHGTVFKARTKLLDDNTPPVHWNCRSELLPLTRENPRHRVYLDDKSRAASNRHLAPLPIGWGKR